VLPQAPAGPRAAVRNGNEPARAIARPSRCEVFDMSTISKVRKQLERSAIKGWRMRYYMQ
jgi:hypothetical protein